jgi:competence protein ComEC
VGAMAMRRPTEPLDVLAVVLLVVLMHDPLSVLSPALWLSFGAVASIALVIWGRCAPEGSWVRFARVQTGVTIGLLPILVATFQGASLASPVANAVAIPVVGMAVVPLTLAGVLASAAGASTVAVWLLGWAGWVLERLWPVLAWLAELPMAWITRSPPPAWALVVAAIGVVLLLMPRGFPGRRAGACLLLPLLLAPAPRPAEGELWLTVLDVGQGLAVVARTASATLLFDSGARFSPRFDAGSAVVVPYLTHAGVNRVDRLVISHADNDHIGGKDAVLAAVAVGTRLGGEPQYMTDARACRDGQGWEWDGVRFQMLYPDRADLSANDASCVLRIESPHGSVLLTGDIERAGEHALVRRHGGALQSDVLVVPHHGSRTSSTPALLNAVRPALAVNSSGAGNSFGHPHPEVVARYETREIAFVDTADSGAVRLRFREGGRELQRYRETHRRYWHADH